MRGVKWRVEAGDRAAELDPRWSWRRDEPIVLQSGNSTPKADMDADGSRPARRQMAPPRGAEASPEGPLRVYGRVLEPSGQAAAGAHVTLFGYAKSYSGEAERVVILGTARAERSGLFNVQPELPPEDSLVLSEGVWIGALGANRSRRFVALRHSSSTGWPDARLPLVVPSTLTCSLPPPIDADLPATMLYARGVDSNHSGTPLFLRRLLSSTHLGPDGAVELRLPPRPHALFAVRGGRVCGLAYFKTPPADGRVELLRCKPKPVSSPAGDSLAHAGRRLTLSIDTGHTWRTKLQPLELPADSALTVPDLEDWPESWVLTSTFMGLHHVDNPLSLTRSKASPWPDLHSPGSGHPESAPLAYVLTHEGSPYRGMAVIEWGIGHGVYRGMHGGTWNWRMLAARPDESGRIRAWQGLPVGRGRRDGRPLPYRVRVRTPDGLVGSHMADLPAAGEESLNVVTIELQQPGRILGRIGLGSWAGSDVPPIRVVPMAASPLVRGLDSHEVAPDEEGGFEVRDIAPGVYELQLDHPEGGRLTEALSVAAGAHADCRLTFDEPFDVHIDLDPSVPSSTSILGVTVERVGSWQAGAWRARGGKPNLPWIRVEGQESSLRLQPGAYVITVVMSVPRGSGDVGPTRRSWSRRATYEVTAIAGGTQQIRASIEDVE